MDKPKTVVPENLPADINAETLLGLLPEGSYTVSFHGLHKRNTYRDVVGMEADYQGRANVELARMSLYNSLPEFMFHPIDRFDNLPQHEEKERFEEQLEQQQQEIEDAYRFFAPIDTLLIWLRSEVRQRIEQYAGTDIIMQQILGDELTDEQRANRFIRQIVPLLPHCKTIRGNKTLLTLLLRKVFMEEGLRISVGRESVTLTDDSPRYDERLDMELGRGYVGNSYCDTVTTYTIHYWSDDECGPEFLQFIREVDDLRLFLTDYFLSVEEELKFIISHDEPPLRLGDDIFYNYLNYNTNL